LTVAHKTKPKKKKKDRDQCIYQKSVVTVERPNNESDWGSKFRERLCVEGMQKLEPKRGRDTRGLGFLGGLLVLRRHKKRGNMNNGKFAHCDLINFEEERSSVV